MTLWMTMAEIMDEPEASRRAPTEIERKNAAAILFDHVHALHEAWDDESVGCRYKGCEEAFWLLASLQGDGQVSIEDLLT